MEGKEFVCDEKTMVVNVHEGVKYAELVIRRGEAVPELEHKPPIKTNICGVIGTPLEYLKKRINTNQFMQEHSYIVVNRDDVQITLVINEDDEYTRGTVMGQLWYNYKYEEFGINTGKVWSPVDLGMFFKMNRVFFPDRVQNMELVTKLMNFTADVNNKIERSFKENGDRKDNFVQIVNSNLPKTFTLNIPIFKGTPAEQLEVETYAQINGRDVFFTLLSPGANQSLEELRNSVIDNQLSQIQEIAPNIAIIEE